MSAEIIAVLPAYNEEACIQEAVRALQAQTVRPDRIIVVCDNCTDRTEELATLAGADTFVTTNNRGKKAGALNQALGYLLPRLRWDDLVFIQDADTTVVPEFLEVAQDAMIERPTGVGLRPLRLHTPARVLEPTPQLEARDDRVGAVQRVHPRRPQD